MTDWEIRDVLSKDYSAGTEGFRDALLARCLAILGSDRQASELGDEELEMLAAAGSAPDLMGMPFTPGGSPKDA